MLSRKDPVRSQTPKHERQLNNLLGLTLANLTLQAPGLARHRVPPCRGGWARTMVAGFVTRPYLRCETGSQLSSMA